MTAQEANQKTKKRIMELIPLQYDRVMADIEKCIAEGNFVCWTSENLYPENQQKLIDEGYKVKYDSNCYSSTNYKISWEDEKPVKKSRFSFRKG